MTRMKAGQKPKPLDLGDETGDESSPRPDENVVSEIGAEAGVTYGDEEEIRTFDKVAGRDRERWELDPASSEDYAERVDDESSADDDDGAA